MLWNFIFFVSIITIVSFHYYTHYKNLKKEIYSLVKNEAESIAKRFEISASKLYRSNKFIKTIIEKNLKSQAEFIDLLNSIEHFQEDELSEFAKETGLNLIYIKFFSSNKTTGYSDNVTIEELGNIKKYLNSKKYNKLFFNSKEKLILYIYAGKYSESIILIGFRAEKYFEIQKRLTMENLINSIVKHRKEILKIELKKGFLNNLNIILKENKYFIVKLPFQAIPDKYLEISIDATHGVRIIDNFKHNLLVFFSVIFFIGILLNAIIYTMQKKYISSIKEFEKKIYQHEKEAALGRSAALIAHEIRNPVNSVSIGLQRIKYETELGNMVEYSNLLTTMEQELKKINSSIETFIDYSKPLKIKKEKINVLKLLQSLLLPFKNNKVNVSIEIPEFFEIDADKKFFSQALINLIKNAFENEDTTHINIYVKNGSLLFENNGVKQNLETEKIFEPYYTTKTKGSGLGLAVLKKIVEAHNWDITCHKNKNIIKFEINFFM